MVVVLLKKYRRQDEWFLPYQHRQLLVLPSTRFQKMFLQHYSMSWRHYWTTRWHRCWPKRYVVLNTRSNFNRDKLTSVEPLGNSGFVGVDCAAIIGLPESMVGGFPGRGGIIGMGGRIRAIICTCIMGSDIGGIPNGMPVKPMGIIGGAVIIPRGGMGGIPMGIGGGFELPVSGSSLSLPASRFSCSRRSSSGIPSMP